MRRTTIIIIAFLSVVICLVSSVKTDDDRENERNAPKFAALKLRVNPEHVQLNGNNNNKRRFKHLLHRRRPIKSQIIRVKYS